MHDPILETWKKNALPWAKTVENGDLPSRQLGTDQAICSAIEKAAPTAVLDMGCGEGWLCRALAGKGYQVIGVDGVPELIERAKAKGGARYVCAPFDAFPHYLKQNADIQADAAVFNFSLFDGDGPTLQLLQAVRTVLPTNGQLFIQTIHPSYPVDGESGASRWITENWSSMKETFEGSYRWYFRSLESWQALILRAGFHRFYAQPVTLPRQAHPISVILSAYVGERP